MANPNLLDKGTRVAILEEIKSEENHSRKREHQKRFDIARERQDRYILERLHREFNVDTVDQMRKIFSINLAPRIINEMSGIYNMPPERIFSTKSGRELTENELAQLDELYSYCNVNPSLRKSNQFYNTHDQCALMVVPDQVGKLKVKAIPPLHYDVIPDSNDPEKAYAYILNVWDYDFYKTSTNEASESTQLNQYRMNDQVNQAIAEENDRQALLERYIVWTSELHFTMDGKGNIVDGPIDNPIGMLPFIDIATDKDFEFFVRRGTSICDFALDFGLILSDTANTIRLQNYSQAIMTSEKQPQNLVVGPNHVLWLPLDPNNPGAKPSFEFASPSPDIQGSLDFAEMTLRLFLSSRGIDPGAISGKGDAKSFSSGVERLLAMLDKFEATRMDYDLYKNVEYQLFDLLVLWSNYYQLVRGQGQLDPELLHGTIGEDVYIDVKFAQPTAMQTESEKEDSVIKQMENGLMSRKEALMKLREVSEEAAEKIIQELDEELIGKVQESSREIPVEPEPETES